MDRCASDRPGPSTCPGPDGRPPAAGPRPASCAATRAATRAPRAGRDTAPARAWGERRPGDAAAAPVQLALFGAEPAAASPPAAPYPPAAAPASPGRPSPASSATAAGPAVAAPSGTGQPPPRFHHPRAEHQVLLGEHRVGYAFRRARRRSIGFSVGPDGLAVAAPRWVSIAEVEQALKAKQGWILRKLHEQHERAQRLEANRIEWRDGARLPFLGEPVTLVLDPRVVGAVLHSDGPAPAAAGSMAAAAAREPAATRLRLHLGLAPGASPAQIRELVQAWLQRQARRLFEERCAHFAPRLGVTVRRLSLSSAATRWGSASADGSVRLHWRLVHFALPVIDYVVTHELAHLREMNHSPAFWEVVRSVLPDYERHRGHLRSDALPVFD